MTLFHYCTNHTTQILVVT